MADLWDDVQPVKEVFAERFVFHHLFEVGTGRGNDADIHFNCAVSADPLKFAFLKNPQKFDLQGYRHISDFIQKNRSAVGLFESADAGLNSSGESALDVSKQFRFQKVFRDRSAIDAYQLFWSLRGLLK